MPPLAHPLLGDPFVVQQIDRALATYAPALCPGQVDWMRLRLAEQMVEDPTLLRLLDAAYPRDVSGSGERQKQWLALADQQPGAEAGRAMGDRR